MSDYWDVNVFTSCSIFEGSDASTWSFVRHFCDYYEDNCYFFASTGQGNGPVQQNNAIAIKLIIEKCDALQAQVDLAGNGLSMQAIIDTLWESNKIESFHFINYIDAMRASIWNVRIQEEHLHEWYRHFLE